MVPPVADHVRGGRLVPPLLQRADAVNWRTDPVLIETGFGLIVRLVRVAAGADVTRTTDVSARPQLQVAMTAKVPAICPAAKSPPTDMVPPVAL
jgi:hypothetical protein